MDATAEYLAWQRKYEQHSRRQRPFTIVFCGVFSSGKTSLINRLLDTQYKLPTGITPITKVVTRIQYGSSLACHYEQSGRKIQLSGLQAAELIRGNGRLPNGITDITIEFPCELLRSGVVLVDTPGFDDEMGGQLERISRGAVEMADYAVFCCNALQLGKEFERSFLQELKADIGNFCMVVTRMDNLNTDADAEDIRWQAASLMGNMGNAAGIPACQRFFLTICDGLYMHYDDVQKHLQNVLDNQERIRASTAQTYARNRLEKLERQLQSELREQEQSIEQLSTRNNAAIVKAQQKDAVEKAECENKRQQIETAAQAFAESALRETAIHIVHMDVPTSFVRQAEPVAQQKVRDLARQIASFAGKYGYSQTIVQQRLLSVVERNGSLVPEPVAHRVQARNAVEQGIVNTLSGLFGNQVKDDGYDVVYDDFQKAALRNVKGVMQALVQCWKEYAQAENKPSQRLLGGYETEICALDQRRREIEAVLLSVRQNKQRLY